MNKGKMAFGIIGALGVAVFIAAILIGILMFESGAFSPLNGFVGELGVYPGAYLTSSTALIFNICLAVSGLLLAAFMVGYGIQRNSPLFTAASFFGILTGILIVAQAVFSLNFTAYHYIVTIALFGSVILTGVLLIIALSIADKLHIPSIGSSVLALGAAGLSAAFVYFMAQGGMAQVFVEDASQVARPSLMPFALIEWLALILVFGLLCLLAIRMIMQALPKSKTTDKIADKAAKNNERGAQL